VSGTRTSWLYRGLSIVVEEWGGVFAFVVMTREDRTIAGGSDRSFEEASRAAERAADALLALPRALAG
jgi:hypothetical protein